MNEQKSQFLKMAEMIDRHLSSREAKASNSTRQSERWGRLIHWFIPNGGTLLLVALLIFTVNVWAKPLLNTPSAPGPSATTINYQGRLANADGVPRDGNYGMRFALYDAPTGGNLVWGPELHDAVPVSDGLFSVGLGSQTAGGIPTDVWGGDVYLEITVGGETLSPRELIRSVPIAGMALTVPDGSITTDMLARSPSYVTLLDRAQTLIYENPATTNDDQWHDLDISSVVPSDSAGVILQIGVNGGKLHVCPLGEGQVNYLNVSSSADWDFDQGIVKLTSGEISYRAGTNVDRFFIKVIGYIE